MSENGIDFGFFTNVWNPPAVGLDYWDMAGITYLSFLSDRHGHVDNNDVMPVYCQARKVFQALVSGEIKN